MRLPRITLLVIVTCLLGNAFLSNTNLGADGSKDALAGDSDTPKKEAEGRTAKTIDAKAAEVKQPKKVIRTDKEWQKLLTRDQFRVLRRQGTEPAFRNKYDKHFEPGTYACAACGQELFASETKFNSGCGWPAFYAAKAGDRVILRPDYSNRMIRMEVICARCDSHLGHVFRDAPQTPTGARFCINSVSLKFIPAENGKKDDPRNSLESDKTQPSKTDRRARSK